MEIEKTSGIPLLTLTKKKDVFSLPMKRSMDELVLIID